MTESVRTYEERVEGRITDEAIQALRARIGVDIPGHGLPANEYATKDGIRRYATGLGDPNPLWSDEDYARKTHWGGIIAPPPFVSTMGVNIGKELTAEEREAGRGAGMPGVHSVWAGTQFEWFLPIPVDERLRSREYVSDVQVKAGKFAQREVLYFEDARYWNQRGELVSVVRESHMRYERHTAREEGKYKGFERHRYTDEELAAIERDYDAEELRGSTPRYWEDVQVGESITPVVKGPLRVTDLIANKVGYQFFSPFTLPHKLALEHRRRHPGGFAVRDLWTNAWDANERVHWDWEFARYVGAPGAYDFGPGRISWMGHMMTNWMGDDGFFRKLEVQLRRFNVLGDTTWCKGRVAQKFEDKGQFLVECEVWAENQRGETIALGRAVVALPSRGHGPVVLFSPGPALS